MPFAQKTIRQQVTKAVKMLTPSGNNLKCGNVFSSGDKKDAHESIIIRAGQPLFTQGVQVWLFIGGWT